jgi:hypothetical protein
MAAMGRAYAPSWSGSTSPLTKRTRAAEKAWRRARADMCGMMNEGEEVLELDDVDEVDEDGWFGLDWASSRRAERRLSVPSRA